MMKKMKRMITTIRLRMVIKIVMMRRMIMTLNVGILMKKMMITTIEVRMVIKIVMMKIMIMTLKV